MGFEARFDSKGIVFGRLVVMRTKNRAMFEAIAESILKKYGHHNVNEATLKREGYSGKMATLILMYIATGERPENRSERTT